MGEQLRMYFNYNKKALFLALLFIVAILYPNPIIISGAVLLNTYVKTRLMAVGVFYLILRGLVNDQGASILQYMFFAAVILSSFYPFSTVFVLTVCTFVFLRVIKII